jgi:hypothetical protein
MKITSAYFLFASVLFFAGPATVGTAKEKSASIEAVSGKATVLWHEPADIQSRDLFYGPGGTEHVPNGTFTFVKEDLDGTNPKFVVRDQDGIKWKVKLGIEAQPETVASRIVWAVGYYANEDYFVSDLRVKEMPSHLHRGQNLIAPDGSVRNVRLKREDEKKIGEWQWKHDPFNGTRELNGLKVVMALINNWDLKNENNAIYQEDDEQIYLVSDLGASFGTTGRGWPAHRGKGDLSSYTRSKFIRKTTVDTVDFETPSAPSFMYWLSLKETWTRVRLEWIGRNIPRVDARWMGDVLARLSPKQIRDAFRAGGYSPEDADAFARVMEGRIAMLTRL